MSKRYSDVPFSAKNMSSNVLLASYTSVLEAGHRFQLMFDNVAGSGSYTVYMDVQYGGTGTTYPALDKTTVTVATGQTNFMVPTMTIDLSINSIVNFYALGRSVDTSVNGKVVVFADNYLAPTTVGRTLDVAATGEAGLDFDNIKAASAPTTLTNITVPVVTTTANVTLVNGLATDVIDAASIKLDAITEIQAGLSTLTLNDILTGVIEGTLTLQQILRIMFSALAGKSNGGGTVNVAFRDIADTKDRIAAVVDVNGNRTSVTRDGS